MVAVTPMREPATVIASTTISAHQRAAPEPDGLPRGGGELAEALPRDEQHREREQRRERRRPRERAEDADPVAELGHHRDLHGARDPGEDGEGDDEDVHGGEHIPGHGEGRRVPALSRDRRARCCYPAVTSVPSMVGLEPNTSISAVCTSLRRMPVRHSALLAGSRSWSPW